MAAGVPAFGSPSVADGYFYFNSDANGQAKAHDVFLTGNGKTVDCTGKTGVTLSFYYQYADASELTRAQVGISTDGTNFTYHTVLGGIPYDGLGEGYADVSIPEADNQPKVWIRFRWTGNWDYHWKIDDLSMSSEAAPVACNLSPLSIICDNLDTYKTTMRLGPQATHWTTWSGTEGTTEDGIVSTEQAASAPNSLKIISTAAQGGPQDVVLNLGNKTAGHFELKWKMFIPTGKNGYYNIQNVVPIGSGSWNLGVYFSNNGAGNFQIGQGPNLGDFTYPNNAWFDVVHDVDLDNNLLTVWIDGKLAKQMAYPNNLGGIDFYGANNINTYYVDNVEYVQLPVVTYNGDECKTAVNLSGYLGQAAGIKQTTPLYDNSNATISASDPGEIDCWGERGFSGDAYDFVDNSLWYTFVGDGNSYHIETVPCNATNYIGVAQQDTGDTQIIIYAGSDCSNLTEVVACNEDLANAVDFRAGLNILTDPGQEYLMLVDGFNFQGTVASGEFCLEITLIPTITCDDGAVGSPEVQNDGWICDGTNIADYLSAQTTDFVVPPIGPIFGVSWAFTTEPVPAGTWPPSMTNSYGGSYNTVPAPYLPSLVNDGGFLPQNSIWYFTPVVVAMAVDTGSAANGHFLHELDISDACFFTGESAQLIFLPPLDGLQATTDFIQVTNPPGNNGAIDLTVTGGLFDLVMDPGAYAVSWSGPNGFMSQDEDIVNLAPGSYTATISDITGCVDDVVVTVSVTVPTTDPKSVRSLSVTPNPAHDAVLLNLALTDAADVRVEVVDMLGQVLETVDAGTVNTLSRPLDLSRMAAGTYLLRVNAGNETALRRIVVQR